MRGPETPVYGESDHTCPRCRTRTRYTGLLFVSEYTPKVQIRHKVRNCPRCFEWVLPLVKGAGGAA